MALEYKKSPLISIIIPAYNCENYIERAIRSVMEQTYSHWELIIIDDCSSDATVEVAAELAQKDERIRLLKNEENIGVANTRNRGFDLSCGEFVALLDSDDEWYPEKLQCQLDLMVEQEADIGYTSYEIIDVNGDKIKNDYLVPESAEFKALLKENFIGCSTVMLSRRIVNEHRFVKDFYHEDYVLWLDLLQYGYKAVGCRNPLVKWRFIANSRSYDKRKSAKQRWNIYRKHLRLPLLKSGCLFAVYIVRGVIKYV